ncbi:hypothetical protein QBC34DRAFT_187394 [Podospora aff. communis PSN243]|uniref:RING-type domain-containing protein n=1 Tax=Podospora aff. communis PSN243 TaxID=3040156 RepID=A0AAV9G763_9PEZI|nr:hypothetical protein QBC34DRAFT_187394 [Podospora aff. communis PSN243]
MVRRQRRQLAAPINPASRAQASGAAGAQSPSSTNQVLTGRRSWTQTCTIVGVILTGVGILIPVALFLAEYYKPTDEYTKATFAEERWQSDLLLREHCLRLQQNNLLSLNPECDGVLTSPFPTRPTSPDSGTGQGAFDRFFAALAMIVTHLSRLLWGPAAQLPASLLLAALLFATSYLILWFSQNRSHTPSRPSSSSSFSGSQSHGSSYTVSSTYNMDGNEQLQLGDSNVEWVCCRCRNGPWHAALVPLCLCGHELCSLCAMGEMSLPKSRYHSSTAHGGTRRR